MRLISLGMPVYGDVKVQTVVSLLAAIHYRKTFELHLNIVRGTHLHLSRNLIVRRALAAGASHVLFVDADMIFPANAVERLLSLEKAIVGVTYNTRSHPPVSTMKPLEMPADGAFELPGEPFQVAALGTGLMLVDCACFKAVGVPWFDYGQRGGEFVSEDVRFCEKARAAGLEVWCDPTIEVGHIGERIF